MGITVINNNKGYRDNHSDGLTPSLLGKSGFSGIQPNHSTNPHAGLVDLSRSVVPTTRIRGVGANIEVTSLVFIALPPLGALHKKQLEFEIDGNFAVDLYNATNGFSNVRPDAISEIAGRALTTSAGTEQVNLPNRDQHSYVVLIELMSLTGAYVIREVVVGFTDHDGISKTGAVDPNMTIYIGSVTTFKQKTQLQSNEIIRPSYYGGCQVITSPNSINHHQRLDDFGNHMLLRPVDVMNTNAIGLQRRYDHANNINIGYMDTTVDVGGGAKTSNVDNLCPNKWLGDVLSAYIQPMHQVESEVSRRALLDPYGDRGTNEFRSSSFFDSVIGTCTAREPNFTNTLIFKGVFKDNALWGGNSFTINSLTSNLTIPQDRIHTFKVKHQYSYSDVETWMSATTNARIAYGVLQTMPHILLRFMLSRLTISITNMIPGNQLHVGIANIETLFNRTLEQVFITELERQIKLYIVDAMIKPSCVEFNLVMDINVLHLSTMDLSTDGSIAYSYMMPTFAEAFMSMISTKNQNTILQMSDTMDNLSTYLSDSFRV